MSRIFIPRSVAETSMPYIIKLEQKEFEEDKVFISNNETCL